MQVINHIEIRDGQAYILQRGHLKAEMVARMVVDGGYSIEETMTHYELRASEVHAALVYYYDNQDALDKQHEANWQNISDTATSASEHLEQIRSRSKLD